MKTNVLAAAALAAVLTAPAFAGGTTEAKVMTKADTTASANVPTAEADITSGAGASVEAAKPSISVVSRGADGKADVVNIDGQTYKVCKTEAEDSCINPRAAGLNFGARELQYWPGKPASEIATPLPATPPA